MRIDPFPALTIPTIANFAAVLTEKGDPCAELESLKQAGCECADTNDETGKGFVTNKARAAAYTAKLKRLEQECAAQRTHTEPVKETNPENTKPTPNKGYVRVGGKVYEIID